MANRVIAVGDSLFGSSVVNVGLWSEGLNDSGDIAFSYFLADGRFGVAVAHVPGAGAIVPLGLTWVLAVSRRRRR